MESSYFGGFPAQEVESLRRDGQGSCDHLWKLSVALKCAVVDEDPEERTGRRNILNAGHTVGHALEALGVQDIPRKAVAAGLLWESAASLVEDYLDKSRSGAHPEAPFRVALSESLAGQSRRTSL